MHTTQKQALGRKKHLFSLEKFGAAKYFAQELSYG